MKTLRIGYDAKRAFHNGTGLGNYSRSLIEAIASQYPFNSYYLFNPKSSDKYFQAPNGTIEIQPSTWLQKKFSSFWRSFSIDKIAQDLELDLYHGMSHELPFGTAKGNTKWVLTVHDLIFIRFPHYFKWIDTKIYAYKLKKACQKADCIIAISEQTKSDLVEYLELPAYKIQVVYQDCHPIFKEQISTQRLREVALRYSLPSNFLLQVGTIEPRKNLQLSIKALSRLPQDIHLVAIGRKTDYFQQITHLINDLGLNQRVHFYHDAHFNDFPAIYHLAKIFLYPSQFEGFGIPIIEALHCGTPVIAATGSCLEEAGGPSSVYIDPDNEMALASQINRLLEDQKERMEMKESGYTYVKRFESSVIAEQLMNIYQEISK
ncbi:glycosyltransferase family 4 protein [Olivibacter sitiensis]|uniref:glycosyltransferase family 4 protein n=1 Tax=Olivibacter sitiensis TaxID=376470 RepID=UPI001FE16E9C|nr:glycosyltransferase family 1 protein [Olivibacter sitiensis]